MSATYSTPEVCELAGVTYRQLDYWCREGLVTPAVHPGRGAGTRRRFAPRQVATVAVLGLVAAPGQPLAELGPLAAFLEDLPLRYWARTHILVDPAGQVWRIGPGMPPVGTYLDLAVATPVIGLIASHKAA